MSNIILNPGFEDGTTSWTFATDGSGAFTADTVAPYSGTKDAKLVLSDLGTSTQLYQDNVPLAASTPYRLSFAAYSNFTRDVKISLFKNASPFTNYGLSNYTPNLGSSWAHFSTDFTTNASATIDARLQFYFTGLASNGDIYYIDEIKLEKISEINGKMFLVL